MRRALLGVAVLVGVSAAGAGSAWSLADGERGDPPGATCNGLPATEVDASHQAQTGTAGDDVVVLVGEGAVYDALGGNDSICLSPTIRYALVNGDAGDDHVDASAAQARRGYSTEISGGPGSDEIVGSAFRDVMIGGSGDDVVEGGAGGDLLDGDGVDRVGRYSDPLVDGADHVDAGPGNDRIYSSVRGDDGASGADESIGGPGRDTLDHGPSRAGIVLRVQAGVVEGTGTDVPDTFEGFERYEGSGSDDLIVGTEGDDHLDGDFGRDRVFGLGGDDRLELARGRASGGPGDDLLSDGANGPRLRIAMGPGDDRVSLLQGRHTVAMGAGNDRVEFEGLRGTFAIGGGPGFDRVTTIRCKHHRRTGDVVTCDRSTATITSVERVRNRG